MKEKEAPEKIYLTSDEKNSYVFTQKRSDSMGIEYTRTDAFIDKACDFLKSYRKDTPDGMGYIAGIVNDKTIDDFKNYMKGE